MRKRHVMEFDEELAIDEVNGVDARDRVQKARENFKPMYLITQQREDEKEPEKIDMAFDCNNCMCFIKPSSSDPLTPQFSRPNPIGRYVAVGKTRLPKYFLKQKG